VFVPRKCPELRQGGLEQVALSHCRRRAEDLMPETGIVHADVRHVCSR
jgi:hypothetical protein